MPASERNIIWFNFRWQQQADSGADRGARKPSLVWELEQIALAAQQLPRKPVPLHDSFKFRRQQARSRKPRRYRFRDGWNTLDHTKTPARGHLFVFQETARLRNVTPRLVDKAILVEGPSDELIIQRAYQDKYGRSPLADGIDVISVGLAFERFLSIAKLIGKKVAIVTDNDGNPEKLAKKIRTLFTAGEHTGVL